MPRLSVMMFLQFFIWGSWYVSMPQYMKAAGIQGLGAWAYTVGPIAAVISPFLVGMIADRYFATQRVLGLLHILGGAIFIALPNIVSSANQPVPDDAAATFSHPFVLLLLAHMLCFMPTLSLTNSLAFAHMSDPSRQFPPVRVLGTIGWIVGNIVVGGSLAIGSQSVTWIAEGPASAAQWYIAGGAGILLGLFSFTLPHTPPPAAGKAISMREVLGLDSLKLLGNRSYLVFILCSFLLCIPLAGYYSQAFNFLTYVNANSPSLANNNMIWMSLGQVSEILFMVLMPLCFARLGVKWMLAVGMLAWVVRYGLFAGAAIDQVFWMTLVGIVLHGICYDFFFVTGFIYVDKVAPTHIRNQAQGFLVFVTQGLGMGIGAIAFGKLVTHYQGAKDATGAALSTGEQWKLIWIAPALFALAVLVFFVIGFRQPPAESKPQATA
jgi:nucleoside transporter